MGCILTVNGHIMRDLLQDTPESNSVKRPTEQFERFDIDQFPSSEFIVYIRFIYGITL